MTDEHNGSENGENAAIGTPAVTETKPKDPVPSKPATEADLEKVEERMSGFERSTLRWTRASFVIVAATAAFICFQWLEMRSGGKDTHALATAASQQATHIQAIAGAATSISSAADNFSKSVSVIRDETQKAVQELKRTADDSEKAINQATRNAEKSLRISQRPYLTVENVRFDPPLQENQFPIHIRLDLHNSGRTPALKQTQTMEMFIGGVRTDRTAPGFVGEGTIAADRSVTVELLLYPTGPVVSNIKSGIAEAHITGTASYIDIFKDSHQTKFCAVWDHEENIWKACPGNDVE